MEAKSVPALVEYRQMESSLVVAERVVDVVPAGYSLDGEPLKISGGVVSMVKELIASQLL